MKVRIAIDGACRRNGRPDCISSSACFIQFVGEDRKPISITNFERESTSQRGELVALATALEWLKGNPAEAAIITDSEYLFNAMTKHWFVRWTYNGWLTAAGEPVKNADLWMKIVGLWRAVEAISDICFYHIKGHVITYGKVTTNRIFQRDQTGDQLRCFMNEQYEVTAPTRKAYTQHASELFARNNGFYPDSDTFKTFVVANSCADVIATYTVEEADKQS